MAVAIDGSRTAEIKNPVGRSHTRNVESKETEIIQVDVGEKTYCQGDQRKVSLTKSVIRFE